MGRRRRGRVQSGWGIFGKGSTPSELSKIGAHQPSKPQKADQTGESRGSLCFGVQSPLKAPTGRAQPLQQSVTFSKSLARALLGHTEGLKIMGESEW